LGIPQTSTSMVRLQ